ncbi:hypothetical protein NC653_029689 [Populus alba x Populus x berolinensis]|uniref:Uncharacterized protein n=1 Tax=Populus alba x Populus x berolinensis TaxID=444605 RepID=A0AAD6Q3T0_9ROSI|nr:hypothetical protein NC653_029689 [Populus alba x Populus x berolinensis]
MDISVYKLDFNERVWIRIKKLKDQAIFIGSSGAQLKIEAYMCMILICVVSRSVCHAQM